MTTLKINGKEVAVARDTTVLEAARGSGIEIPTLCHDPRLEPYGGCRLCIVEIEGTRGYPAACATTVAEGMDVTTESKELRGLRQEVLRLILSDHPNDCMVCEKTGFCELQNLAYELDIDILELPEASRERRYTIEDGNPLIRRDYPYCILCGRCVRIHQEVQGCNVFDFMSRGFETVPTTAYDRPLEETSCVFCGQCSSTCPTAALTDRMAEGKGRIYQHDKTLTVCPYCGCGCRLELYTKGRDVVRVSSPIGEGPGQGNLCIKGRYGYDVVNHPDRLTAPLVKRNGKFEEASWEEAYRLIGENLGRIRKDHGPQAFGALSSAKCTSEESYLMQKFARAVMGTSNIDHCARLCHAPTVPGLRQAFGSGAMTNTIADIAEAKAILITGSNTTEAHPIIALSVKKAVRNGAKLIVLDPRRIELARTADIWVSQKSGTDVALFNGIMHIILRDGLEDKDFISKRTENIDELKETVTQYDPERVSDITGVSVSQLEDVASAFAGAERAAILYAMGITQHTTGTDNVLSVANLALLTGNLGKRGAGVNPLRGHNNVQGSCDMGALFNSFPGYQSIDDPKMAKKFSDRWGSKIETGAGLSLVEMTNAAHEGRIKAMYILAENPMLSDPDLNHVKEAFEALDFMVVQEIFMSETAELADVVLPGVTYAEKDGTFTNTERRVQRVRKAIEPVGNAKPDWQILCEVAGHLGYEMSYSHPSEIMDEIAELVPQYGGISYERLENEEIHWPCPSRDHPGTPILHTETFTRGLGKFHGVEFKPPAETPDGKFSSLLTTGRSLYHFHTGTMSRRAKGLTAVCPEGFLEMNPADAKNQSLKSGDRVLVTSRRGQIKVRIRVTERSPEGTVFLTFHFAESPVNVLTNPALDPVAKIPEFKISAVKIEKV